MTSAGTTHLRPPFCTAAVADLKPSVLVGGLRPYFNRPAVAQVVPYRCERGLAMPLALPVSLSLSLSLLRWAAARAAPQVWPAGGSDGGGCGRLSAARIACLRHRRPSNVEVRAETGTVASYWLSWRAVINSDVNCFVTRLSRPIIQNTYHVPFVADESRGARWQTLSRVYCPYYLYLVSVS